MAVCIAALTAVSPLQAEDGDSQMTLDQMVQQVDKERYEIKPFRSLPANVEQLLYERMQVDEMERIFREMLDNREKSEDGSRGVFSEEDIKTRKPLKYDIKSRLKDIPYPDEKERALQYWEKKKVYSAIIVDKTQQKKYHVLYFAVDLDNPSGYKILRIPNNNFLFNNSPFLEASDFLRSHVNKLAYEVFVQAKTKGKIEFVDKGNTNTLTALRQQADLTKYVTDALQDIRRKKKDYPREVIEDIEKYFVDINDSVLPEWLDYEIFRKGQGQYAQWFAFVYADHNQNKKWDKGEKLFARGDLPILIPIDPIDNAQIRKESTEKQETSDRDSPSARIYGKKVPSGGAGEL